MDFGSTAHWSFGKGSIHSQSTLVHGERVRYQQASAVSIACMVFPLLATGRRAACASLRLLLWDVAGWLCPLCSPQS